MQFPQLRRIIISMNEGALANLNDDAAIAEIASGVLSKQIARRYGVTPYAVRKRLAKHPDYAHAVQEQATSFVEEAVQEIRECPLDQVAIARARAKADVAFKWAAARDPANWGIKQQLDVRAVAIQIVQFQAQTKSATANLPINEAIPLLSRNSSEE